jgi:hypothetical protein
MSIKRVLFALIALIVFSPLSADGQTKSSPTVSKAQSGKLLSKDVRIETSGLQNPPPGLRIVLVTPPEFATGSKTRVPFVNNPPGLLLQKFSGAFHPVVARVRIPLHKHIRWFDCAINGLETGQGRFEVHAELLRVDYTRHPDAARPEVLGKLKLAAYGRRGDNGKTFGSGVRINNQSAIATDTTYFLLRLHILQDGGYASMGLRGCRVGYR